MFRLGGSALRQRTAINVAGPVPKIKYTIVIIRNSEIEGGKYLTSKMSAK